MPAISTDKIKINAQFLVEQQQRQAEDAIRKIQYNLLHLINCIPVQILDENISELLKKSNGDLNIPFLQYSLKIQVYNEQKQEKNKMQLSPSKQNNKKKVIKMPKKILIDKYK